MSNETGNGSAVERPHSYGDPRRACTAEFGLIGERMFACSWLQAAVQGDPRSGAENPLVQSTVGVRAPCPALAQPPTLAQNRPSGFPSWPKAQRGL